jgi:hypothetical protein
MSVTPLRLYDSTRCGPHVRVNKAAGQLHSDQVPLLNQKTWLRFGAPVTGYLTAINEKSHNARVPVNPKFILNLKA